MENSPIVTVQEGKLSGKISIDYHGGKYYSFQGIPYAKPPIGELRFKSPEPPKPWSGVRDATREGNPCYHRYSSKTCVGSEDCLFLNVYTPELNCKNCVLKPVMVWIHGGAFTMGSGNTDFFGPDFLITESVVIVTFNYRLGFLGFLSLEDPSLGIYGNAGLKDQVLALKWVQKNIFQFSGNPNNVTIFGESSGAVSVHYLLMSPMAKGLFHKAIIQSGTVLDSWARGQRSAPLIAKVLGHETVNEKAILNILNHMSMEQILQIQEKIPYNFEQCSLSPIGPVVENKLSKSPFLLEDPVDLINSSRFSKVPLMIGYNSKEGIHTEIWLKSKLGNVKLHSDCEIVVPWTLGFQQGSSMSKEIALKIKDFYYGQANFAVQNSKEQYYNLETDSILLSGLQYSINRQIQTSSSPIYLYRMSLDSTLNLIKKIYKISIPGACHGDELGYLFKSIFTPPMYPGSMEDDNIKKFVKLWTTFAKNGDPNPIEKDLLINVTWKPVEKGKLHYLDIGDNLTVGINPELKRMEFWDKIFKLSPTFSKL